MGSEDDGRRPLFPPIAGIFLGVVYGIVILMELADCGHEPPHPAPRDIETAYAAD